MSSNIPNFFPREYNKSSNVIINDNKTENSINRLTNFIYNTNVNIYEDENYEFKQFSIY